MQIAITNVMLHAFYGADGMGNVVFVAGNMDMNIHMEIYKQICVPVFNVIIAILVPVTKKSERLV